MQRQLSILIFHKLWGWKVTGRYPNEIPKCVVAVAPHTSFMDFPIGILLRPILRADIKFVAKHTLFKGILGPVMRWMGGIPVDRRTKGNFVDATVQVFRDRERLHLCIAPEGTRKKVERFKSGFYHIARLAGVPIVLCTFDWEHKIVHFDEKLFYPTEHETADLAWLWNYYKGVKGYHPEQSVM
jgi:1-acyl-sn-glycerol-3-phosphate acyltransferase